MSSGREMILDIFHMEIMYLVILYRSSNEGFMTQLQFFFPENVHADSPMYKLPPPFQRVFTLDQTPAQRDVQPENRGIEMFLGEY